jgi:hypothetical protein
VLWKGADVTDFIELVTIMLQSEGMTVECVFDPTSVLKAMGSFSPELP